MTNFFAPAINPALLPKPNAIDPLDFEKLLAARMDDFTARADQVGFTYDVGALETDPIKIDNEVHAYRELLMRARVNDGIRAVLPAFARGTDLDAIVARANVTRASDETDDALLVRYLTSYGAPAAGSIDGYYYHAATAWPQVRDVAVLGPAFHGKAGRVEVYLLAPDGGAIPEDRMLAVIRALRNTRSNRPLTDMVYVAAAPVQPFETKLRIRVPVGPDPALVASYAKAAVENLLAARFFIGGEVFVNALAGAAYVANVERVTVLSPAADIAPPENGAALCTSVTIETEVAG